MIHRLTICVICSLALFALSGAEQIHMVDEDAIQLEMEEVIDQAGEISEETFQRAIKILHKGVKAHDHHQYAKAIKAYQQALEVDPLLSNVYYEMAFSFSSLGKEQQALDAIIRAIALDPKQELYHVLKGTILDDAGFNQEAIKAYRKLLELQPESYLGRINLGVTLERTGSIQEAEEQYRAAIETHPESAPAYFHLARICRGQGYNYDEQKYLETFVEYAGEDPRLEGVQARLKEMKTLEVNIDPSHPYLGIESMEKMSRAAWKTTRHHEMFPEARGYRETFKENQEVFDALITSWRERKQEDPEASFSRYDMLTAIADAGFSSEYIWYSRQGAIGDPAQQWIKDHPQRMEAFLAWARSAGYMPAEEQEPDPGPSFSPLEVAQALSSVVYSALEKSERRYVLGSASEAAPEQFRKAESRRYRRRLDLGKDSRIRCRNARQQAREFLRVKGIKAAEGVLRCFRPGDEEYIDTLEQVSILSVQPQEITFHPGGAIEEDGLSILLSDQAAQYATYIIAKAAWRGEAGIRSQFGGPEAAEETVLEEELFALRALGGGYQNFLVKKENGEVADAMEPDPALDRLVAAIKSGDLLGYALFEVIHKYYDVPLETLSAHHRKALQNYLGKYVLTLRQ